MKSIFNDRLPIERDLEILLILLRERLEDFGAGYYCGKLGVSEFKEEFFSYLDDYLNELNIFLDSKKKKKEKKNKNRS